MNNLYFILDNIRRIVERSPLSAHTPGHKNGRNLPPILRDLWGEAFARYDLTELDGLDNLHFASGCIAASQRQAAAIYGAGATYYLVNGTTGGLQAAIIAACRRRQVFVPRHAHRSIYHSLILAEAEPVYLPVTIDEVTGLPLGVAPEVLLDHMERFPECGTLIVVNPTYQGITWQNEQLIRLAKARGLTVIVDEAHGSHLHFHEALPMSMLDCGADLVVQSWHKTLPVLTQGSALHVHTHYTGAPLDEWLSLLQTTSPSYLTMASLEAGSIWINGAGRESLAHSLLQLQDFFQWLEQLSTIARLWRSDFGQDPFKLYLISDRLTGPELAQLLLADFAIYAEMSDSIGCLLMLPLAVEADYLSRVQQALLCIDQRSAALPLRRFQPPFYAREIPVQALPLREAFYRPKQQIPWQLAAGCIAGGFIIKYPPGIPICVPGEIISDSLVEQWLADAATDPLVTVLTEE